MDWLGYQRAVGVTGRMRLGSSYSMGAVLKIYHSSMEVTTQLSHATKVDSAHDLGGGKSHCVSL